MKPQETMKNVKAKIHSLHTAIAVVIVTFATASWGMMAYIPAITDEASSICSGSRATNTLFFSFSHH